MEPLPGQTPPRLFSGLPTFLLSGGIAALCNLLSRAALSLVLPFPAAVIVAYMIGMAVAFVLFRVFVFKAHDGDARSQGLRFVLVNLVALAQVFVVSLALNDLILPAFGFEWHREAVAHFIGVASPVLSSWFLHKHFTFRPSEPP